MFDLVNAIKDASVEVDAKELLAVRAQEYFDLVNDNITELQKALDKRWEDEDAARVTKETGELALLQTAKTTLDTTIATWETEKTRLQGLLTAANDTDSTATADEKAAA